jgi:hypothetical protein
MQVRAQAVSPDTPLAEMPGQRGSVSSLPTVQSTVSEYIGLTPENPGTTYSGASQSGSNIGNDVSISTTSSSLDGTSLEPLLDLYYRCFHGSHPCVLPPAYLKEKLSENLPGMGLLISVMRFIGSLYAPKVASGPLEAQVTVNLAQKQPWPSGFEIQALVIYSIATFWCDNIPLSEELLMNAITKAIGIGLNTKSYAVENSGGDPVMAESWRRTWWQIYTADLHIAATNHMPDIYMRDQNVHMSVDLPCEEEEYSSGVRARYRLTP